MHTHNILALLPEVQPLVDRAQILPWVLAWQGHIFHLLIMDKLQQQIRMNQPSHKVWRRETVKWTLGTIVTNLCLYTAVSSCLSAHTWTLKWPESCHAPLIIE